MLRQLCHGHHFSDRSSRRSVGGDAPVEHAVRVIGDIDPIGNPWIFGGNHNAILAVGISMGLTVVKTGLARDCVEQFSPRPWGELLDTVTRQTSLNDSQTHRDTDGKYRIVVSAKDPGVANWIDIADHSHGVFNWRVTTDTPPATPVTEVVPVAELAKHLPADTKYVTAKERQAVLIERRHHSARRLSP